ncbi:MAG: DUF4493 domain-containing protein [Duncaniella sp.]|nr:DUF4493 domain-containing protein [Duncaniella sp.]
MKKSLLTGISFCSLFLALLPGCREENFFGGGDTGRLELGVTLNADPVTGTSQTQSRAARMRNSISVDDLQLTISSNEREWEKTYSSISEFQEDNTFPTGDYTLEAYYGSEKDEGLGKPYCHGETTFSIRNQEVTSIDLPVYLANSIVEIKVTDAFAKFMTSWSFTVTSSEGTKHSWSDVAEEDLYTTPGTTKVAISFTKPNGVSAENVVVCTYDAKPRHKHIVTIDYNGGQVGGSESLKIDLDDAVEQDDTELDISDDIIVHGAPTLAPDGFVSGTTFDIIEGCPHFDILAVNVIARGGIKSVMLHTESPSLAKEGFPVDVDLCAPGQYQALLDKFKLNTRGISKNPGVLGVVDFIDFIGQVPYVENGSVTDNTSKFTVSVVDNYGKEAATKIRFGITVSPLDFELISARFTKFGNIEVDFRFNGDHEHIDHGLHFYKNNSLGIEEEVKIASCSDEKHSEGLHVAELSYPYNKFVEDKGYYVVARTGRFESNQLVITVNHGNPELKILDKPENVFATKAILTLENASTQKAAFQLSTNGTDFEDYNSGAVVNGTDSNFTLTGLKPATKYWVRADVGDAISRTTTFTTEAATQITNGNLNAIVTTDGSGRNWKNEVFSGWGTNNPMTTSQGGDFAYCRISGTTQVTDAKSSRAACLRTVGWGSGNSAIGTMRGEMKYADAGLLHLGSSRSVRPTGYNGVSGSLETSDLDCGIYFASRPVSMTFYYKYSPKNSADRGQALYELYDAQGNIIASKVEELSSASDYTEKTFTFNYPLNTPKAAKLYVRFLSTCKSDALTKSSSWFTPPSFGNLSDGTYMGSQLWIDEVTLNY